MEVPKKASPTRSPSSRRARRFALGSLASATALAASCGDGGPSSEPSSRTQTVVGSWGARAVDFSKPTRILAAGHSHGMGTQFVEAAKAAALRYREAGWTEQIVFVAKPDVGGSVTDAQALERYGIKVVFDDEGTRLTGTWFLRYLANFGGIASVEYFGHSSFFGVGFEDGQERLSTSTPPAELARVAGRFLPGAFVALHGCNAGAELAPHLSRAWKIPVLGALTGTNFQRLHSNGRWFFNDPGLYPSGPWAAKNAVSFKAPVPCREGACLRMKPENASYRGYWGNYDGGLGFYKTFCAPDVTSRDCAVGAANALLATPTHVALTGSSPWVDVERAVLDFLCPNPSNDALRDECFLKLRTAAFGSGAYSPFRGTTLKCTVRGCDYRDVCETNEEGAPIPGTCERTPAPNPNPMEYVEEARLFLAGFAHLKGQTSPAPKPSFH